MRRFFLDESMCQSKGMWKKKIHQNLKKYELSCNPRGETCVCVWVHVRVTKVSPFLHSCLSAPPSSQTRPHEAGSKEINPAGISVHVLSAFQQSSRDNIHCQQVRIQLTNIYQVHTADQLYCVCVVRQCYLGQYVEWLRQHAQHCSHTHRSEVSCCILVT